MAKLIGFIVVRKPSEKASKRTNKVTRGCYNIHYSLLGDEMMVDGSSWFECFDQISNCRY